MTPEQEALVQRYIADESNVSTERTLLAAVYSKLKKEAPGALPDGHTEPQLRAAVRAAVRRVVKAGAVREKAVAAAALGAAQGVAEPPGNVDAISAIQPEDITRRFKAVDEDLYVEEAVREARSR